MPTFVDFLLSVNPNEKSLKLLENERRQALERCRSLSFDSIVEIVKRNTMCANNCGNYWVYEPSLLFETKEECIDMAEKIEVETGLKCRTMYSANNIDSHWKPGHVDIWFLQFSWCQTPQKEKEMDDDFERRDRASRCSKADYL